MSTVAKGVILFRSIGNLRALVPNLTLVTRDMCRSLRNWIKSKPKVPVCGCRSLETSNKSTAHLHQPWNVDQRLLDVRRFEEFSRFGRSPIGSTSTPRRARSKLLAYHIRMPSLWIVVWLRDECISAEEAHGWPKPALPTALPALYRHRRQVNHKKDLKDKSSIIFMKIGIQLIFIAQKDFHKTKICVKQI